MGAKVGFEPLASGKPAKDARAYLFIGPIMTFAQETPVEWCGRRVSNEGHRGLRAAAT